MWKFLFHNFTKCCIVQQLPAPGYIHALCILDMLSLLITKLALTISFLPFRCSSFHAYITCAIYKYEILVHSPSLPVWSQGMTGVHTPHWGFSSQKMAYGQTDRCSQQKVYNRSAIGAHLLLCAGPPPRLSSSYTRRGSATHPCFTSAQHPLLSHIIQLPPHSAFMAHWAKLMLRDSPGRAY